MQRICRICKLIRWNMLQICRIICTKYAEYAEYAKSLGHKGLHMKVKDHNFSLESPKAHLGGRKFTQSQKRKLIHRWIKAINKHNKKLLRNEIPSCYFFNITLTTLCTIVCRVTTSWSGSLLYCDYDIIVWLWYHGLDYDITVHIVTALTKWSICWNMQ
jgi:hypothetical protein